MNTASLQFLFMLCLRGLSHASKAFRLVVVPSFAFFLLALCGHWSSGEDACLSSREDYGPYDYGPYGLGYRSLVADPSFENVCPDSDSFCFPSALPRFPSKESELELVGSEDVGEFGLFNGSWEIGLRDFKNVVELNRKATSHDLIAEALNSDDNFKLQILANDSSGNTMTKVLEPAEPEECVLAGWKSQGTNSDVSVLIQGPEVLLFPMVQALFWARVEKALQPVLLAALFTLLSFFSTSPAARSESRSRSPPAHCSKKIKKPSESGRLLNSDDPKVKEEDLGASEEPKPGKEKGRRRRKRKGPPGVSSSRSGNSTPTSPNQTRPLSPEAGRSRLVQNPLVKVANKKDRVLEPVLQRSAASVSGTSFLGSKSGLALQDRAPGPKRCSKKDLQQDEFIYDIWGDHYSGLCSIYKKDDESESFFVRATHPQNCISAEFCKLIQ